MFLLGLSLAILLIVSSIILGGAYKLIVFWDAPSAVWVFLGVLIHILCWGRPYFLPGLKAVLQTPKTGDAAISEYFRRLTVWTVGVGVAGMAFGTVWSFLWLSQTEQIGAPIAISILTFFYAACLALMVFAPISVRFSIGETEGGRRFPLLLTLFGLAAYFLTRAGMVILLRSMMLFDEARKSGIPAESLGVDVKEVGFVFSKAVFTLNPTDYYGTISEYLRPQLYWDLPSLLLLVWGLLAFWLSAGKPKSRFDWIPIAILYGMIGSVIGMVLMLSDLDPTRYSSGCMVALLTTFYGFVAAVFFAIGSWRLVRIFFLGIFATIFTWAAPYPFLAPFAEPGHGPPTMVRDPIIVGFFLTYAAILFFLFKNVVLGVRELERFFKTAPIDTDPMTPDEEEARKILDSAVVQSRSRKDQ